MSAYTPIRETLIAAPMLNILLSAKATPPADLALVAADFAAVDMYASIFAGLRRGNFPLGDSIRIIGIGMWCNISDGLVQNDSPDNVTTGIGVQIRSQSYNVADAQQQADVFATPIITKIHEFNFMFECDYFIDFSSLQYSLTGFPQPDGTPSGYTRLNLTWNPATSNFATITVDPAFAAKRLIMRPMLLIEHTRTVFPVGF